MTRLAHAWDALEPEQRLTALAALGLWVTLLLPWYHENVTESSHGRLQAVGHNVTGFGAFSFVEAAVLLVSVGVWAMLFARGEGRRFHLPGRDGSIVVLAGGWTALLVFYRMLDTPSLSERGGRVVTDVGPQFGIFLALLAAGALAYAGWRMRAAAAPEPPLLRTSRRRSPHGGSSPADEDLTVVVPSSPSPQRTRPVAARPAQGGEGAARPSEGAAAPTHPPERLSAPARPSRRPRYPPAPSDQLSFDDEADSQER
jgi:hypothetical protein